MPRAGCRWREPRPAGCAGRGTEAALYFSDTPVGYMPPKGPDLHFTLSYNQLEESQPENFTVSHLGPNWSHNWMGWVQDDPLIAGSQVWLVTDGGRRSRL